MYISAIDRVRGTKKIANGFIKGFNLKNGAIAMTKNSHAQSLLVAGTNHEDMYLAVKTLEKIGGGNIVVAGGKVLKSLPLEYFGLESADTIENVVKLRKELYDAITSLGCSLQRVAGSGGIVGQFPQNACWPGSGRPRGSARGACRVCWGASRRVPRRSRRPA